MPTIHYKQPPMWVRFGFKMLAHLPAPVLGCLGVWLGYAFYYLDRRHRHITLRNLARIFPEKPKRERILLAKQAFVQVGRTVMEIPLVFERNQADLLSCVQVEGENVLKEALAEEKGVFLMASHFSNWELMGLLPSMLGYETSTIYRPLNQQAFDDYTLASRTRFGTHLFSRKKGLRWLFSALKNNHCIIVALDQHMGAGHGVSVPFLGHIASTTQLPVPFVHRDQTPMVGMALERMDNSFRFKLRFWRIQAPETSGNKTQDEVVVMTAACKSFEKVIKENPEQWLWMHRRWRAVETDEHMEKVVHGAP